VGLTEKPDKDQRVKRLAKDLQGAYLLVGKRGFTPFYLSFVLTTHWSP